MPAPVTAFAWAVLGFGEPGCWWPALGESLPPLWVVSPLQGEDERNVLLQPHLLPLAHSARSLSTSQVSVCLKASAFVLLPTASGRSWSCCPSRVGHTGQRSPVTSAESPGPVTMWAMLCHPPFLPLAVGITEHKQFFLHLDLTIYSSFTNISHTEYKPHCRCVGNLDVFINK